VSNHNLMHWFIYRALTLLATIIALLIVTLFVGRIVLSSGCLEVNTGEDIRKLFDIGTGKFADGKEKRDLSNSSLYRSLATSPDGQLSLSSEYMYVQNPNGTSAHLASLLLKATKPRISQRGVVIKTVMQSSSSAPFTTPNAIWSPNSQLIAYFWEDPLLTQYNGTINLAIANKNGTELVSRSSVFVGDIPFPLNEFSADGGFLATLAQSNEQLQLTFWDTTTLKESSEPVIVSPSGCFSPYESREKYCALWSPNPDWVAYTISENSNNLSLILHDLKRGYKERISLANLVSDWTDISWSPDGNYIMVSRFTHDSNLTGTMTIYQLDGTEIAMIQNVASNEVRLAPEFSWSENSQWLYFKDISGHRYTYYLENRKMVDLGIDLGHGSSLPSTEGYYHNLYGNYWLTTWTDNNNTEVSGIIDITNGKQVKLGESGQVRWSPSGYAIVVTPNLIIWSNGDGSNRREQVIESVLDPLEFMPNGEWLVLDSRFEKVYALNLKTGYFRKVLETTPEDAETSNLAFPATHTHSSQLGLVISHRSNNQSQLTLKLADLQSEDIITIPIETKKGALTIDGVAWSDSGSKIALSYGNYEGTESNYTLVILNNRGELIQRFDNFDSVASFIWTDCS
jgi:hypothetical protein